MSEDETNIGDILGGVIGIAAPMMTGVIKSMLSPEMIKSVVGMVPNMLGAVVDAVSSIDIGELISSTMGAILPIAMKLLDPLLNMLGPIIEAVLDMVTPVLEIVGPLLEAVGPIFDALTKAIGLIIGALTNVLKALLGSSS